MSGWAGPTCRLGRADPLDDRGERPPRACDPPGRALAGPVYASGRGCPLATATCGCSGQFPEEIP